MHRHRSRLAAALAVAGTIAALPAAASGAAPAEDRLVMAKLVPFSEDAAREVADRAGVVLDGTIPEIGWASYTIPGDVRRGRAALLRTPGVWRIDHGTGAAPRVDLIPSDTIFTQPGSVAAGQLKEMELALGDHELPGGVGHRPR